MTRFIEAFVLGFLGGIATGVHMILWVNPFWFRGSALRAYKRTNLSKLSLIGSGGWF